MTKKLLLIPVLTVAVVGASLFGATHQAQAETTEFKPMGTIVEAIAEKFNLNKNEVQAVFDEQREKHHTQMQEKLEDRLTQAVKDGKLTEAQKTAILEKHAEMQADHESLKEMTPEERHTYMQEKHDELKSWAEEQGIDLSYLMMGKGMGQHHGMMKMHFDGAQN